MSFFCFETNRTIFRFLFHLIKTQCSFNKFVTVNKNNHNKLTLAFNDWPHLLSYSAPFILHRFYWGRVAYTWEGCVSARAVHCCTRPQRIPLTYVKHHFQRVEVCTRRRTSYHTGFFSENPINPNVILGFAVQKRVIGYYYKQIVLKFT